MLSKKAVKILRFMKRSGGWHYQNQIEKSISGFDYLSFRALVDNGYLAHGVDPNETPDCDEYGQTYYPEQYRISDKGLAYLEGLSQRKWVDLRSWLAIAISIVALIVSALKQGA